MASAGLAGVLMGCVAARLEHGAYVVRSKGYRVVPPASWERIDTGADLAWGRVSLGAALMAHGTCEGRAPWPPLPVLVRHLRFGLREVSGVEQTPVEVGGQPALRSRFAARLDGVPVSVSAVTVKGPRCIYDLIAVAPEGRLDALTVDFRRFTESFGLLEGTR